MTTEKYLDIRNLGFILVVLSAMLCAACGTHLVRGEPPMVRMSELSHKDDNINLQLSMRNVNGVPLDILDIDLSLTVDDQELFSYSGPVNTDIVANGTETWSVDVEESKSSRELLDTLQNGEVNSLPYALKGTVESKEDGTFRFEYEGHIYPLPGRPGHFR